MQPREPFPIISQHSLSKVGRSHTLRCDARQSERRFLSLDEKLDKLDCFFLNEFLPSPIYKGVQPVYLDTSEGVPVINTLSIQNLRIHPQDCRFISDSDFALVSDERIPLPGDVLLTMDGGTSIGKPVLFDLDGDWTVDSHVAILRPRGISAKSLVYLLASPLGQLQFDRAESGASGQTSVTEEDLRRFRFPRSSLKSIDSCVDIIDSEREEIRREVEQLAKREARAWEDFSEQLLKS